MCLRKGGFISYLEEEENCSELKLRFMSEDSLINKSFFFKRFLLDLLHTKKLDIRSDLNNN